MKLEDCKVGTMVAAYLEGRRKITPILEVMTSEQLHAYGYDAAVLIQGFGDRRWVHPKQLRRLRKREKREWWIVHCVCSEPLIYRDKDSAEADLAGGCECGKSRAVKVREVSE